MMRCIVVDDEPLIRDLLSDNILQIPFLKLVKSCKNSMEAIEVIKSEVIDLVFLDIQMPGLNGFQLLQSLSSPPLVVLVTAYEKYALKGFDLNVVDYLLKPFSFERFLKACNRANDLFSLKQNGRNPKASETKYFFVYVEYNQVKVVVDDIDYIETLKDYIRIHLSGAKPVLTRMTMKAVEEILKPPAFLRIHKSFLVAAGKVTSIKRDMVCIGNTEIPIGSFYKDSIIHLLNNRTT